MKGMYSVKKIKLPVICLILIFITIISNVQAEAASLPYDTYNYDYWGDIHYTPAAYEPVTSLGGADLYYEGVSIGKLVSPQDICTSESGEFYIADTGNNRIVVLNHELTEVVDIISTFDNNGIEDSFNQPYGVYVSSNNQLYIADSQNKRIVVLNEDDSLEKVVENPTSESLEDGFVFTPLKVAVDYADRIYVIAQNMFEGIMVFESDGAFSSFYGTIDVTISLWEKFWKRLATKEERSNQQLYVPTEFTGISIDEKGFVYATNIDAAGTQGVRRLNSKGEDVIKKGTNENLGGDIETSSGTYGGVSQFVDVVYRGEGIYSCLDRKRGRIFTYDHEGNLLYIFGGLGTQEGTFSIPAAIEMVGDRMVVLDSDRAELVVFSPTEYGNLINEAVALRYDGDETLAVELWQRVLELDENNELANSGIGKAYLTSGDYESAMKYLKLAMNQDYYSIALKRYRNAILGDYVGYFLTGIVVLTVLRIIYKRLKKKGRLKRKPSGNSRKGGVLSE